MVTADFDVDGNVDVATVCEADSTVVVLLGAGDGSFSNAQQFAAGVSPRSLARGELPRHSAPEVWQSLEELAATLRQRLE